MTEDQVHRLSSLQQFAAVGEAEIAVRLIDEGLRSLRRVDGYNDSYHPPLQLLAQGFERLLKLILILGAIEQGEPPETKRTVVAHDLVRLTERVVILMEAVPEFNERPAIAADIEFLRTDEHLSSLIQVLGRFGGRGRYWIIDVLLDDPPHDDDDPRLLVDQIKMSLLGNHPEWRALLGKPEFRGFHDVMTADLVELLQRYARALSRSYTLGVLGRQGRSMVGQVKRFLYLRDQDLRRLPD